MDFVFPVHSFLQTHPFKKRGLKKYKLGFKLMKGALKIIRPKRQKKKKLKNRMEKAHSGGDF